MSGTSFSHAEGPAKARDSYPGRYWREWLSPVLLLIILALAATLRFAGINWDDYTHPHPDERFLTMAETKLRLPSSLGEYFDTDASPLNPHNTGDSFFVYGTLPIFLVRYLAEWLGQVGYDQVHLVGRAASASFDIISVLLVYLIGSRLYRRRVGLLAAAFAAFCVLFIQHAHYFVVDPFANTFILLGFYAAVLVYQKGQRRHYALFGLALGMAMASKISAAPLAGVIVLAALARFFRQDLQGRAAEQRKLIQGLVIAAVISFLAFRIFQPYAFADPSFFNIRLNPKWLANLSELSNLSSGNVDFPPAWQWADRTPILFSLRNLVLWGMGLPLGVVAWGGWLWALLRMLRGEWQEHVMPVVWTGLFFIWQSIGFTKAMRYQLPVYPTLLILAAWALWKAWDSAAAFRGRLRQVARPIVALIGLGTLLAEGMWAFAFSTIYTRTETRAEASRWIYTRVPGSLNLIVETEEGDLLEPIPMPQDFVLHGSEEKLFSFTSHLEGSAKAFLMPHARVADDLLLGGEPQFLLQALSWEGAVLGQSSLREMPSEGEEEFVIALDEPFEVSPGESYEVRLASLGSGELALRGSVIVIETGWDLALPVRIDGRDGYGGLYTSAYQEIYWSDSEDQDADGTPDKLQRIVQTLEEGDFLAISSNRQYASITRVPVRFPLTIAYYRALLGCPAGEEIWHCGAQAEVGKTQGTLGYDLVAVFESNPQLGPFEINDQGAEEAFTVYDHAKVLIFAKSPEFSAQSVRDALGSVDVSGVVNILPKEAHDPPPDLMLPEQRWEEQQESGTWSDLNNRESIINRSQPLAVLLWWMLLMLIGWIAFPIVRLIFPGLQDGGYPLARIVGLLILAWASWMLGSFEVPFVSLTVWLVLLALLVASGLLAWRSRRELADFIRGHRKEILWTEIVALGLFLLDLGIRLGNPDLWHPYKGGERPMEFSYLNAVLKSVSFPPYDPWFAGGYINYYYFGFVIVAIPIKMLGLIPSVAFNLAIPTLFAFSGLGAYCIGYNLLVRFCMPSRKHILRWARLAGLAAMLAFLILGNLGTGQLLYQSLQRLGVSPGEQTGGFIEGPLQSLVGVLRLLTTKEQLPIALDQWYWNPSRSIPAAPGEAGPITEFPFFTFLYGDMHPHMMSMPLALAGVAWGLSWLLAARQKRRQGKLQVVICIFGGALVLGALRPTNTWDMPLYLGLGILAIGVGTWMRSESKWPRRIGEALLSGAALGILALLLYQPYAQWYGAGYTAIDLWHGSRTSLGPYLTVHGLFLFVLVTWMAWETRQWMARTPLSRLSRLRPFASYLWVGGIAVLCATLLLIAAGYAVALIVIPACIWAALLFLRPDLAIEKRIVLLLVAVGLALTLAVEIVVLRGDISRMNTVFKFYLQVWLLFSVSAGAAFVWLLMDLPRWRRAWRQGWSIILGVLVFIAALYPITASLAKIQDRMASNAPQTLDSMAYMPYATYSEVGEVLVLAKDYHAIQWLQDTVQGTPVIVEANTPEYRWGSRMTIYTGLPGVLGWNWHQRQQRVASETLAVTKRALDITSFYQTRSVEQATAFLARYGVRYVVAGELEYAQYGILQPCWVTEETISCDLSGRPMGMVVPELAMSDCTPISVSADETRYSCVTHSLEKFEGMVTLGILQPVYREGDTVIYWVVE